MISVQPRMIPSAPRATRRRLDPKIVELKIFNTLPHMLIPVVTEPKKVPAALKWLLAEMEQLEVPEIAVLEGIPVGTAASRLRAARQQFRVLLEAERDRNPFSSVQ